MTPQMSDEGMEKVLASGEAQAAADDPSTIERIQAGFEQSFSQVKDKLGDSWQDVRTIYEMITDDAFEVDRKVKYVAIGALAYLVSPVDLLPERTLGPLGLVDDVAVLGFALKYARPEVERYRAFKAEADDTTA